MNTVTLSPKYQVVIPSLIRKTLDLKPGQKFQVVLYEGRIELLPIYPMPQMRGFLAGIDTTIVREDDRL